MTAYPPEPGIPGEEPAPEERPEPSYQTRGTVTPHIPSEGPKKTMLDEIIEYRLRHPAAPQRRDGYSNPSLDFRPDTFKMRQQRALELNHPIDPYKFVYFNDEPIRLMNLPTPDLRATAGYGHFSIDIQRRLIIPYPVEGNWPYTPETCVVADGFRGVWVDESHLACPGCGMGFT